jgi:hypothetical protein
MKKRIIPWLSSGGVLGLLDELDNRFKAMRV